MKTYVICAQMWDQYDWCWEEVERTPDEKRAITAAAQGCHIYYEEVDDEDSTIVDCHGISTVDLPF